jgi:hypothetical protein
MISYFPVVTGSLTVSGSVNISGGITASGGISISGSIASASFASTASFVALAQSASNAVSAATASFANAFTVAGNLTAQTLVVQTITSSVDFVTGSTRFGSIAANTHVFTGSMSVSGSISSDLIDGGVIFTKTAGNSVGLFTNTFQISGSGTKNDLNAYTYGNNDFGIWTNANKRLTITGGGSVGIGTSSPAKTLDILGSNGNATAQIKVKNTGNTSAGYLGVFSNSLYISAGGTYDSGWSIDGTNGIANIVMETSNGGSAIAFGTANSNTTATERMRITSAGVLLINNTYASPFGVLNTYKTPVNSNYVDQIVVQGAGNYPSLRLGTFDQYDGVIATTGNDLRILSGLNVTTENHNIRFYTGFVGSTTGAQNYERMRIEYNGYVGIGAASPATTLHVAGPIGIGSLVSSAYPQNVKHAKSGSTSVTFTITVPYIGAWYAGQALIKCAGARNGLEEQYAAMYFVRLTYYGGGGVSSVVNNVSGDTANASVSVSGTSASNPQVITITVSDAGASTNTFVADIDATFMGGVISIS